MKIASGKKSDISGLKALWKVGFGEEEAFLNFYFPDYFDYKNALFIESEQVYAASLVSEGHKIKIFDAETDLSYIMGVVTHPDFRKKGYSKKLMEKAVLTEYRKGIALSALIPAEEYLFDIYRKYGFTETLFASEKIEVKKEYMDNEAYEFDSFDIKAADSNLFDIFYDFYSAMYGRADISVIKSKEYFKFTILMFLNFEGEILTLRDNEGHFKACAFVHNKAGNAWIKEGLFLAENYRDRMIQLICDKYGAEEILVRSMPIVEDNIKPIGMARVLNAEKILKIIPIDIELSYNFKLTDPLILENNGVFSVRDGKVSKSYKSDCEIHLDINNFTELALRYQMDIEKYNLKNGAKSGFMNLMLN